MNELHFGDNLDVLRATPSEHVDLIYLDPPFNSNASYNVLYGTKRGGASKAQAHAFEDTWTWGPAAQKALDETARRHVRAGAILDAFNKVFPGSDVMAYLAIMAVRLVELHRVLKPTGSLYLHCDPTASHYLKLLLDGIFGPDQFRSEIIWKRTSGHADAKRYGPVHDTILFYSRSDAYRWVQGFQPYDPSYVEQYYRYSDADGRRFMSGDLGAAGLQGGGYQYEWKGVRRLWRVPIETMRRLDAEGRIFYTKNGVPRIKRFLDEAQGMPTPDVWTDIEPLRSWHRERIGYSTQKPLALLQRIIKASSDEGDVVLDPFCGCGTAVEAAEKLKRRWIGIDITYLAIHVIESRLVKEFAEEIKGTYRLFGRPKDADDAMALAARDWLEFQKWAVFMLGGLPNDRPGPDGGIDGVIRYHRVGVEQPGRAVVSVKGGQNVGVDAIHKLKSVVKREGAEVGVLVCLNKPSKAMVAEILSEGEVGPKSRRVQKLQIITVDKLFERNPVDLPGMIDPPEAIPTSSTVRPKRGRKKIDGQTELLLPLSGAGAQGLSEAPARRTNRSIRVVDVEVTRPEYKRKAK